MTAYWPFHNTSYEQHVVAAPEEGTEDYNGMLSDTALGRMEQTTVFNSALIDFSSITLDPSSDEGIAKSQIDNYLVGQITAIVMAKDDEEFESKYEDMLAQLDNLGLEDLNKIYDDAYKANCEEYGETLTNANADKH